MHNKKKRQVQEENQNQAQPDSGKPLAPGTAAPNFILPSTSGNPIQLSELNGRPVVLAFYPADHSPVCSSQLALYNEALPLFKEFEAELLGISIDDPASHDAFAQNLNISFPLLADYDPSGAVARAFGVFDEEANNARRALFVLDRSGVVRWSYVSPKHVNPGANGILAALESL
ncbi:MAG: redoxin domain-containing protein [Candidatus Promineifilaceae bacterium]